MRCKGLRRDGEPCGNTTRGKNKLCFWHLESEQAQSKRDVALNLRVWTPAEMALVFQKEIRRFLRGKISESKLHELRRSLETVAEFSGKKFKPFEKEKKSLTLKERIERADKKQKSLRRLK